MQREILFKAKRKDDNEWIKGCLLILESGYYIVPKNTYYSEIDIMANCTVNAIWEEQDFFEVIPETISQYTGLKDKNDVKIFENDKVKYKYIGKDGEEKEYIPKIGVMNFKKNGWHINSKWLDSFTMNMLDFEVIGNIFDKEVK